MPHLAIANVAHLIILALILADDLGHQLLGVAINGLLKHIAGKRLIQAQQPLHHMRHIKARSTGIDDLIIGNLHHLIGLCRGSYLIFSLLGNLFHVKEKLRQLLADFIHAIRIDGIECLTESHLREHGCKDMLRHDKLMAVGFAQLHRLMEQKIGIVAVLQSRHGLFWLISQTQRISLVAGHLSGLSHFRHGDVVGIDSDNGLAATVDEHHEALCLCLGFEKNGH